MIFRIFKKLFFNTYFDEHLPKAITLAKRLSVTSVLFRNGILI